MTTASRSASISCRQPETASSIGDHYDHSPAVCRPVIRTDRSFDDQQVRCHFYPGLCGRCRVVRRRHRTSSARRPSRSEPDRRLHDCCRGQCSNGRLEVAPRLAAARSAGRAGPRCTGQGGSTRSRDRRSAGTPAAPRSLTRGQLSGHIPWAHDSTSAALPHQHLKGDSTRLSRATRQDQPTWVASSRSG